MLILFICIVAFANAITVIDFNQSRRFDALAEYSSQPVEYPSFIDQKESNLWINALLTEWLLGLGEFETGEYNQDYYSKSV